MYRALVGHYSAHAMAFTRTILSRPEPQPHIYHFPLFSILDFSMYAAIAAWRPDTRDGRLQG